jgi:N6-L-threonylcarbamoyladenine synthase
VKILSIETSCDETGISVVEGNGGFEAPQFKVLANTTISQINIHTEYGGVFPALAKREHQKNLPVILETTLKDANLWKEKISDTSFISQIKTNWKKFRLKKLLTQDAGLYHSSIDLLLSLERPDVDYIAVTYGPGLEPALWVGINFAKALHYLWGIPVIPVNHMEGHILSVLLEKNGGNSKSEILNSKQTQNSNNKIQFPALALLISGGHTELIHIENWQKYKLLGETRDDAVGEAFDKVARILGLPYPGGPEISRLAKGGVQNEKIKLPRPMINSGDYSFSFSGLKTAALYLARDLGTMNDQTKADFAREFEIAATDVLLKKTLQAVDEFTPQTIIVSGGVSANAYIKEKFVEKIGRDYPGTTLLFPTQELATDNAIMIAMAGYFDAYLGKSKSPEKIRAFGNLKLS